MEESNIKARKFDAMMEIVLNNTDSEIVIDNGASAFIPLSSYLLESRAIEMAEEHGHAVILHTIVTGGQAFQDTATGLDSIIKQFPKSVDFVVWLNEYFVPIAQDGKAFREMKLFQTHEERIKKVITLPKQSELFNQDMREMLEAHLTFDETMGSAAFQLMRKARLFRIKKALFEQMEGL